MVKELNFNHDKPIYSRGSTKNSYYESAYKNKEYYKLSVAARDSVRKAIRNGKLKCLKKNKIACEYCGYRATVYEHRDYNRPLDVLPACNSCNAKLGAAEY